MTIPYLLMAFLYLLVAVFAALDAALTSYDLMPWFNGLRWLRVHFVTLGVLTQIMFGILPGLVALRAGRARPAFQWGIWATLNSGLVILLIGVVLDLRGGQFSLANFKLAWCVQYPVWAMGLAAMIWSRRLVRREHGAPPDRFHQALWRHRPRRQR